MNLQSKLIGACVGALVLLASPAVQANPSISTVSTVSAINAANAANSAVQSAVRNARDDAARKLAERTKTGEAEVHAVDTDIIRVLAGTAVFVTGGTVVEPKTTAPNELRGSGIRGGETRRIAKGDVLIVPKGTPHWFQQVSSPFNYSVVKVR